MQNFHEIIDDVLLASARKKILKNSFTSMFQHVWTSDNLLEKQIGLTDAEIMSLKKFHILKRDQIGYMIDRDSLNHLNN